MAEGVHVLLVEDDDVTREAVERGLAQAERCKGVVAAEDGIVALDILRGRHPARRLAPPHLVLLDLNMPRMDGFEFLAALREDERLKGTVAFVLTTSNRPRDRARAYESAVAGYMVKSELGPRYSKLAQLIDDYAEAVILP